MFARSIWSQIEPIHAVTYVASESIEAAKSAGLRGFWMGYFGFRASEGGVSSNKRTPERVPLPNPMGLSREQCPSNSDRGLGHAC